jgi:hypothetical protein
MSQRGNASDGEDEIPSPIRLSEAQRANIAEWFDPVAIETIANLMSEAERRSFLEPFGGVPDEAAAPRSAGNTLRVLMGHSDPRLQALLEEMWAPFWNTLPPEALTDSSYSFPGRKLAQEQRLARERGESP